MAFAAPIQHSPIVVIIFVVYLRMQENTYIKNSLHGQYFLN